MANGSVLPLPLGFRFSPSDEQLIVQYLRPRAVGEPLPLGPVVNADIQQHNLWDLVPENAKEKYFCTRKGIKYPGGRRANRAAGGGYWRSTGSETPVYAKPSGSGSPVLVGMRRALVFYRGQPPAVERTAWVMHEYRLAGAGLMLYRVMRRANRNCSTPPCATIAKQNDALAAALRALLARAPLVPVMVNPDLFWVICRIYKKKKRAPCVIVQAVTANPGGGAGATFIDFMGQANREPSPTALPRAASV